MTRSLKTLALSLVTAASVTVVGFANETHPFGSELENSDVFTNSRKLDTEAFFNAPAPKKDDFSVEKIAQSTIPSFEQIETDSFLDGKLGSALPQLTGDKSADDIFNISISEARIREATELQKAAKLAKENKLAAELCQKFLDEQEAKRAAAAAPSSLQVFGGYAYSAGALALQAADYAARSWPGAYLITYASIGLIEEGAAYAGYAAATGLTAWCSGGNLIAAQAAGNTAYYGIKGGFKIAHTIGSNGAIAALATPYVSKAINFSLDAAPVVATGAVLAAKAGASAAMSAVSYLKSFWA